MWLASRDSEPTGPSTSGVPGRLERPKMWRSVEHLRSVSLSCAPEDSSITERVSRDMESSLKGHPRTIDSPASSRLAFNLDEERKRMAEWVAEQERLRKVSFAHSTSPSFSPIYPLLSPFPFLPRPLPTLFL